MHYSELIKGYNRGNARICDIKQLSLGRDNNTAIVCGSGPSLNNVLNSDIAEYCDLLGTASIVLAEKVARWIFWEQSPIFGLEPEPNYGTIDFWMHGSNFL